MATLVAGCAASAGDGSSQGPIDPGEAGGGNGGGGDGGGGTGGSGAACPGEPCDLYNQCGCSAGEACDLDNSQLATGATECRPIEAGGQSQSNCTRDEQCAAGYGCFGNPGQCRKFCEGDRDCGRGYCMIQIVYDAGGGDWQPVPDATVCTKSCKPESATGSGCPQDPQLGCGFGYRDPNGQPGSGDEFWYTDCRPVGSGGDAADCSANGDADCLPGFGCFPITYTDDSVRDECRQICVWAVGGVEGEQACAVGTCHQFGGGGLFIGDTEYGLCF
ncbi:MAG TPA: hypothetical protein VKZ63_12830 [Kofleriaceae bacterium]|nr:hypothetical protein [Kofleriaceae bacterium]